MENLLKKLSSFAVGILFCWFVGDWIANWMKIWSAQYVASGFDTILYWTTYIAVIIYFGIYGIKKIKPFWNGVPILLGQPVPWYVIPDGYFWQLPEPLMGFISVYIGQRNINIPPVTALTRDLVEVTLDLQIQAEVTEPYKWASVENADKALLTLGKRNLRILINSNLLVMIPGLKQQFSRNLKNGVLALDVHDENGIKIGEEKLKSMEEEASIWGFKKGIKKCLINKITIPKTIASAKAKTEIEKANAVAENTQINLVWSQLGAGNIEQGKKDWLKMPTEERSKILQAERNKRKVITVDGNAGDFTKGSVAGAETRR